MKNSQNLIHFIAMGGTIDSGWSGAQDALVVNEKSDVPLFLSRFPLLSETIFSQVCAKDSRAVIDEDRKNLVKTVENSPAAKIVITHGTFTMPETARFLQKKLKRHDQTIVLTSATRPLRGFEMSDAPLNLGYAISNAQHLKPGIYIALKGQALTLEELEKKLQEGSFHKIFASGD